MTTATVRAEIIFIVVDFVIIPFVELILSFDLAKSVMILLLYIRDLQYHV